FKKISYVHGLRREIEKIENNPEEYANYRVGILERQKTKSESLLNPFEILEIDNEIQEIRNNPDQYRNERYPKIKKELKAFWDENSEAEENSQKNTLPKVSMLPQ
ncbi:MAG: hypothetical protein AAF621_08270, partial [Pseudomonadota bacterium]